MEVGEHFFKNRQKYIKSVNNTNKEWYNNIKYFIEPYIHGTVLDVGNGGVFAYNPDLADKIFAVDVAFKNTNGLQKFKNVEYLCQDARFLDKIRDNSIDVIIFPLMLHHIIGISQVMNSANRVLKDNGKIIIIEVIVNNIMNLIQRTIYPLTNFLTKTIKKPMVCLLTSKDIFSNLKNNNFNNINKKKISFGKKIDVFNGIFPGLLIIPSAISPHRCYCFTAQKQIGLE